VILLRVQLAFAWTTWQSHELNYLLFYLLVARGEIKRDSWDIWGYIWILEI